MAFQTKDDDLAAIERALRRAWAGASAQEILEALDAPLPLRTLHTGSNCSPPAIGS